MFIKNDRVYVKQFDTYGTVGYTTVVDNGKPVCDVTLDLPPHSDSRQKRQVVRLYTKDVEKA